MVNTTNKDLKSLKQGRVSKSILDAAGSELSTECRNKYPQGIEYCEVAVTPSFQLKQCKKIYHGGIPFFKRSLTVSTESLAVRLREINNHFIYLIIFFGVKFYPVVSRCLKFQHLPIFS